MSANFMLYDALWFAAINEPEISTAILTNHAVLRIINEQINYCLIILIMHTLRRAVEIIIIESRIVNQIWIPIVAILVKKAQLWRTAILKAFTAQSVVFIHYPGKNAHTSSKQDWLHEFSSTFQGFQIVLSACRNTF